MWRRSSIRSPRRRLGSPLRLLAKQGVAPAELTLVEADRPRQAGLQRGARLEQVLAVERVAHLQPQDVARRQPARHPAERLRRVRRARATAPRDVLVGEQLEPDLARVARAREDHGAAVVLRLDALHEPQVGRLREQRRAVTWTDSGPCTARKHQSW